MDVSCFMGKSPRQILDRVAQLLELAKEPGGAHGQAQGAHQEGEEQEDESVLHRGGEEDEEGQ